MAKTASPALLAGALATALTLGPAGAARAQGDDPEQAARYRVCMDLAETAPDEAVEAAQTWADLGGSDPARHCAAVALMRLGHYEVAAQEMETLAASLEPAYAHLQIPILIQSAQAWLEAGKIDRAYAVQTTALAREPNNIELLVDRSFTAAEVGNYEAAIADLDRALANAPNRADILVLRASAYRYLDQPDAALADVEAALRLDPRNAEGHLERGNLRRLAGDEAGAREDWLQVTRLAPDSPAAADAQDNLAKLDVKVE
ncbi:tetratricopeptide repeat protein [Pelagibius marinus]|uniref:tetratricopeptide repeat protein n=1 Tax=Pelagibius marinus TaxID=2762760 RepID=UPI0018730171|nr:tetratricopeptide repeat protein [Pelagibius marinus]